MDKNISQVLRGGVGYFWILGDPAVLEPKDEDARSGSMSQVGDILQVHLLLDDPVALFGGTDDPLPVGLLGVTEHTGVIVLDISGRTRNMNMGGSRASVERFRASTLIAHPAAVNVTSSYVRSVSAYFRGNALLGWAGIDAIE